MPHHPPHRGGHRHGPHGRPKRPLAHGDLRLLILSLIADTTRHGYDLITQIEERTGGTYKPSPGVMYPALEVMVDLGWAEIVPDGAKKTYKMTKVGEEALAENAETVAAINDRLEHLSQPRPDHDDPLNVRGAIQRLHHDVRHKTRRGDVDDATKKRAVEILEAARKEINDL